MTETTLQEFLRELNENYLVLREREAKYANAAPLSLLNQIDDYAYAIEQAEQALQLDTPMDQLQAEFKGLNLELSAVVFVSQEPPRKPFTGQNPYRGLRKFTEDAAEFFFGRTAAIQSLLDTVDHLVKIESSPAAPDLITVLGPSGSGKSSLVRAGLIPALKAGRLPGSERWPIKTMMPGRHPLDQLAIQLAGPTGRGLPALRADLQSGEQALYQLMLESLARAGLEEEGEFVLIIDQFEEVFTLCDPAERSAILDQILYVSMQNRGFIILTMRADFYDKAAAYKRLADVITVNQMLVSPMNEKELREAILLPAEAVGLELEKALVETLLNDTAESPSVLPLLQQALTELFYYRDGNLLTLEAYEKIGGVQGALAHRADAIMDSMPMAQRHMVRRIFMRLVQLGDGVADTRRRATLGEVVPQGSNPDEVENIIKILADANLIVTDLNAETDEVILEVSHEALIKEWPRFQSWLDWDRRGLRIRQQLAQAARDWETRKRDEDSLYRGSRLLEAEEWVAANPGEVNPTEAEFLQASAAARDRAAMENRRRTQRIIVGLTIGLILVALGAIFGFVGQQQSRTAAATAEAERNLAQTAEIRAEAGERQALAQSLAARAVPIAQNTNNSELAALLAVEAAQLNREGQGNARALIDAALREILRDPHFKLILPGRQSGLFTVAYSPDGQTVAAAGDDGTISLWDMNRPVTPTILNGHQAAVRSVAFSPQASAETARQFLASAGDEGIINLWNLSNRHASPIRLAGYEDGELSVAFHPDGRLLASAGADGTIRLWDLSDLAADPDALEGNGSSLWSIAFSPNGRLLAAAGADGTVHLWDMADLSTGQQIRNADEVAVFAVAFSPDSQTLAAAGFEGIIKLWDLNDLSAGPRLLQGHEKAIRSLAFSPDGQRLASTGFDQTVRLWNLDGPVPEPEILTGHDQAVWSIAFSPDGKTVASASADKNVRLWDLRSPAAHSPALYGHDTSVTVVRFNPNQEEAQILASGGDDGKILFWDLSQAPPTSELLSEQEDRISALAFSPDGRRLASGGAYGPVRLWDLADAAAELTALPGHEGGTLAAAFSPNGRILATAGDDQLVRLWDLVDSTAEPATLAGHQKGVRSLAFSPDGQTLASGSFDQTVRLWNMADPAAAPAVLSGHQDGVLAVAFSPGGQRLASAGSDQTIRVWETADPTAAPVILRGPEGGIFSLAFSPDGQTLAAASFDQTVRLWSVANLTAAPAILNGHTGAVLSIAFSPDGETLASGSDDASVRLWIAPIEKMAELACSHVRRNLTYLEWQQFLGREQRYRRTCPHAPVHPSHVEAALELARSGQVEAAISILRYLQEIDPELTFDPAAEARQAFNEAVQNLLQSGRTLARQGDTEQAITKFKQAQLLDPDLDLDPAAEAEQLAAQTGQNLVEAGLDLARQGDMGGALSKFREAERIDSNFRVTGEQWHNLCIEGSQRGQAGLALEACNEAIELEPDNGLYYNSRGLARALAGDQEGATGDFQLFRHWLEQNRLAPD